MKVYNSIVELPLSRFIDVVCDGNQAALIIEGLPENQPDFDQINNAWAAIQQEYSDAIGESEYIFYLNMQRNVTMLQCKYRTLTGMLEVMEKVPFAIFELMDIDDRNEIKTEIGYLAAEVNKLISQSIKFSLDDETVYRKDLKRAASLGKNFSIQYRLKSEELKNIENKTGVKNKGEVKTTATDRRYFQSMLIFLGDLIPAILSAEDMTVFMFCDRIRRYNKQQEYNSRQNDKPHGRR